MLWDLWSQSSNIVELWRMLVASRKEESFACRRRLECFKEGRATWICREFRANYIHIYVSQWVPREQHELLKSYIEKRFSISPSLKRGHRFSKMIFLAPFRLLPPTVGGGSGWRIGWLGLFRLLILRRGQRWTQKCQVLHTDTTSTCLDLRLLNKMTRLLFVGQKCHCDSWLGKRELEPSRMSIQTKTFVGQGFRVNLQQTETHLPSWLYYFQRPFRFVIFTYCTRCSNLILILLYDPGKSKYVQVTKRSHYFPTTVLWVS